MGDAGKYKQKRSSLSMTILGNSSMDIANEFLIFYNDQQVDYVEEYV